MVPLSHGGVLIRSGWDGPVLLVGNVRARRRAGRLPGDERPRGDQG